MHIFSDNEDDSELGKEEEEVEQDGLQLLSHNTSESTISIAIILSYYHYS